MEETPQLSWFEDPTRFCQNIRLLFAHTILPKAIERLNSDFSVRRLSKKSREAEPLPTDQKQLSSYRTRLGTMLEYGLSTEMEKVLREIFSDKLFLTFAVSHEYPDFYLRNLEREQVIKIEMKAVDADSDEQAARFDVPTANLDPYRDFLLFIGWKWEYNEEFQFEFPSIFTFAFISAYEIGMIRDERLLAIGGRIEQGKVLVPSKKNPGTHGPDPGNYGKLWRILRKKDREQSEHLSEQIKEFLRFLTDVDRHSPNNRISGSSTKA